MPLEPHPTDPNKLIMRAGNYNPRKLVAHTVIAGAVFDFMGYLTSRKERIVLSAADEASPAVDAISDFATKRGLSLDNARVRDWVDALAQPPLPVQEPLAWLYPEGLEALQNGKCWTAYPRAQEDCNIPLYIAMPPMPVQEPVARVIDNGTPEGATEWIPFTNRVEPLETGDLLYTAPPLPVQRPWVGLTEQDMPSGEDPMFDHRYFIAGLVYAAKVLQAKNT